MSDSGESFSTQEVHEIELAAVLSLLKSQRVEFECKLSTFECNNAEKERKRESPCDRVGVPEGFVGVPECRI